MKQIINTDEDKCRGCSNCVGACPVGEANIISVDNGVLKICVDSQKCIACGACLRACPYNARYYNDDTDLFFDDLKKGESIALIVAPAFSVNFSNWKAILAWLKTQGVSVIVDVSLGVEICTWAHLRYVAQCNKAALITQPCPPIISYIEKYRPELFKRLSPVFSPILCTAVYLKTALNLPEKIAALTPCPAKANEFEKADTIEYNVTFARLTDYITVHGIDIPQLDFNFDNIHAIPGWSAIMPDRLLENIKRTYGCLSFTNPQVERIKNCGNLYRYLDCFSRCEKDTPALLDTLNCPGGCHNGVGGSIDKPNAKLKAQLNHKNAVEDDTERASLFSLFNETLLLTDYIIPGY